MPQIVRGKRQPLLEQKGKIEELGDLCFLITAQLIIPTWVAKPGWTTASKIRQMLVQKPDMVQLRSVTRGSPFSEEDMLNQAVMAYEEFYRRVVSNYEDHKARQNTDVYSNVIFSKSHKLMGGSDE